MVESGNLILNLLTLAVCALLTNCCWAEVPPANDHKDLVIQFIKFSVSGEYNAEVSFQNNTSKYIILRKIIASCSCGEIVLEKVLIAPSSVISMRSKFPEQALKKEANIDFAMFYGSPPVVDKVVLTWNRERTTLMPK